MSASNWEVKILGKFLIRQKLKWLIIISKSNFFFNFLTTEVETRNFLDMEANFCEKNVNELKIIK